MEQRRINLNARNVGGNSRRAGSVPLPLVEEEELPVAHSDLSRTQDESGPYTDGSNQQEIPDALAPSPVLDQASGDSSAVDPLPSKSQAATLDISVVVPCHNEQDNLRGLANHICAVLQPLRFGFELVFVDDGSTDGSWEVLRKLHDEHFFIRALRFEKNHGQSAALWAGMKAARGRFIITIDADLQNPPEEIPKFLRALHHSDCVCGTRVEARSQGDSWTRIASSRIANWVRNRLSGETISDAGCCFRAFRRECISNIIYFNGAHRFLPTLIRMEQFTVSEIPIGHQPRLAGRTHYGVWNRLFASSADLLAVRWMKKRMIRYRIVETMERT